MDKKQNQATPRVGKKWRWSVIDTLILLLVLLAIGGAVYRVVITLQQGEEVSHHTIYEVYFTVESIHTDVLAEIDSFDAVYLYENDVKLGYIGAYQDSEGKTRPALKTAPTTDPYATDRVMIEEGCLICSAGTMTNGSLMITGTGYYLTRGSVLEIRTDRVLMTVRITDILEH